MSESFVLFINVHMILCCTVTIDSAKDISIVYNTLKCYGELFGNL